MDYSQLHDAQINMMVCKALGHELSSYARIIMQDDATILLSDNKTLVDYCNNPADAWPIIVDSEISLNSYSGTWEASYEYDAPIGAFGTDELVTKSVEGKNPLRTAMIAFLMKQEHSNA